MCLDHPLALVPDGFVIYRRLDAHDGVKGRPIPICRPHLELIFWPRPKRRRVRDELL
jgi:hypothetical protein